MCRIMSLVLTAMLRSGVPFPRALLIAWAGLDVLELPEPESCFIEDLVDTSQSVGLCMPLSATPALLRSAGLGSARGERVPSKSPSQLMAWPMGRLRAAWLLPPMRTEGWMPPLRPPALVRPWPSAERTADEPLFPFDAEPPQWH
jgi:hypothetical protein